MLLAVDIGNSSIKFGVFDGEKLVSKFSIPTEREADPKLFYRQVKPHLDQPILSAIACSVVPEIEEPLRTLLREHLSAELTLVNNRFDFGLSVDYEPLDSLGTDRLVAAFAAAEMYGKPVMVCD